LRTTKEPQIEEKDLEKDSAQIIRATLAIERGIADGLEKMLKEAEASS